MTEVAPFASSVDSAVARNVHRSRVFRMFSDSATYLANALPTVRTGMPINSEAQVPSRAKGREAAETTGRWNKVQRTRTHPRRAPGTEPKATGPSQSQTRDSR